MAQDELAVSPEDMATAAKEAATNSDVEVDVTDSEVDSALEPTIDVDNDGFWGEGSDDGLDASESDAGNDELDVEDENVPLSDGPGIITYKANGKEVTLDLNDAAQNPEAQADLAKKLALVDGARKAFSDKNKYRQQLKKNQADAKNLEKYKASWDKLESIKDDPAELYKVLTGEDFDDMVTREAEKRSIYNNASDEDRQIMDYEERIRRMELKQERDLKLREEDLSKAEKVKYETEKQGLQTQMEREFHKYEFSEDNPVESNRLRKMLWRSAIGDIQEWRGQGYKFNDKMVRKAFRDNASALQSFYKTSVTQGNKAAVETQKANTKEKVEQAATKNYKSNTKMGDLVGKDPLSIFNSFRRGRRK